MILKVQMPDGTLKDFELNEKTLVIGRGAQADVFIPDTLASREHCKISFWDNSHFITDLQSRNGTYLNDKPVKVAKLHPGDRIRVGNSLLTLVARRAKGRDTILMEVKGEMAKGKGYNTILQEIIREEEKK